MKTVLPTMLIIVGLIHILPLVGVLGTDQLANLYGSRFAGRPCGPVRS